MTEVLQKIRPEWGERVRNKVQQKLHKVDVTDVDKLCFAVMEDRLNNALFSAGEKRLNRGTMMKLRLELSKRHRELTSIDDNTPSAELGKPRRCFCMECLQQSGNPCLGVRSAPFHAANSIVQGAAKAPLDFGLSNAPIGERRGSRPTRGAVKKEVIPGKGSPGSRASSVPYDGDLQFHMGPGAVHPVDFFPKMEAKPLQKTCSEPVLSTSAMVGMQVVLSGQKDTTIHSKIHIVPPFLQKPVSTSRQQPGTNNLSGSLRASMESQDRQDVPRGLAFGALRRKVENAQFDHTKKGRRGNPVLDTVTPAHGMRRDDDALEELLKEAGEVISLAKKGKIPPPSLQQPVRASMESQDRQDVPPGPGNAQSQDFPQGPAFAALQGKVDNLPKSQSESTKSTSTMKDARKQVQASDRSDKLALNYDDLCLAESKLVAESALDDALFQTVNSAVTLEWPSTPLSVLDRDPQPAVLGDDSEKWVPPWKRGKMKKVIKHYGRCDELRRRELLAQRRQWSPKQS